MPPGTNAGTSVGLGNAASIQYDIDLIKRNELTKIVIQPSGTEAVGLSDGSSIIEGWADTNSIRIGGSSTWSSAYEDALLAGASKYATDLYGRFSGALGGKPSPVYAVQFAEQTLKSWSGSGEFSLGFDLFFIASEASHDVRQDAARLLNLVYPIRSSAQGNSAVIVAPLGHDLRGNGLSSIRIGQWFDAPPFFVCSQVSNTFSLKTTKATFPLYCKVQVEFVAAQIVTIADVRDWLMQAAGTPVINLNAPQDILDKARDALNSGLDLGNSLWNKLGNMLTPSAEAASLRQPLPVGRADKLTGTNASIASQVFASQKALTI